MPENAILIDKAPAGPFESEEAAAEELVPGKVLEMVWDDTDGRWEVQLNDVAVPGLRVAKGGFEEGLDMTYAAGDNVRFIKVHSGEVVQAYVFAEDDSGDAAVSEGDILYKTAIGDHGTDHPGQLDINATDGVAVARIKEAVDSGESGLVKVEKL